MKRYKFEIVIEEGYDEFWEQLQGTGCDEMVDNVVAALGDWNPAVTLVEYKDGNKEINTH